MPSRWLARETKSAATTTVKEAHKPFPMGIEICWCITRHFADLAFAPRIESNHLLEAIQYRSLDRNVFTKVSERAKYDG